MLCRHLEHVTLTDAAIDLPTLAQVLDTVPDPRSRRGRRCRLGPLLALTLLAVLSGATSPAQPARFITGTAPACASNSASRPRRDRPPPPWDGCWPAWTATPSTPRSAATSPRWPPASHPNRRPPPKTPLLGLAVDGKTLRGSRTRNGAPHLLAAIRHDTQTVLAQRQIEAKSNEIPAFTRRPRDLDLTSVVITTDALHTQHDHAHHLVAASGHYLFIIKGNQPTLPRRLKTLPWREAILNDRTDETAHGRREIRRMKICTARPGLRISWPWTRIHIGKSGSAA
ncbi:ISAs1 family transposase [Nonomuraea thailandensis]|uniref:ISAs1 family transposase n=1 Tax=Nonomuraea thailandensis TaxID=1188745 RepID=UPI0036D32AA4